MIATSDQQTVGRNTRLPTQLKHTGFHLLFYRLDRTILTELISILGGYPMLND